MYKVLKTAYNKQAKKSSPFHKFSSPQQQELTISFISNKALLEELTISFISKAL